MDEDLGLTDREKELKKWNAPYVYREFPKMLFRGTTTTAGKVEVAQRIVSGEGEELAAQAVGWLAHPQRAVEAEDARQGAVGLAAAERAYDDRRLSAAAAAEAAAADGATARHLGEIPARPIRSKPARTE
jgi:hypothetical protein